MILDYSWTEVPDWPGYFVSRCGKVLSKRATKPRILKASTDLCGYPTVSFTKSRSERSQHRIHRLMAQTYMLPHPDWAECVRHINGNPADNSLENLAWSTLSENALDRQIHGTQCKSILSQLQINDLVAMRQKGETLKVISKAFDVTVGTVVYWARKRALQQLQSVRFKAIVARYS